MPTYAYACKDCGHRFDIVQSFTDDALTACPECDGALRKVFNSVGVVFKGSGFYRNDSRTADSHGSGGAKSGTSDSAPTDGASSSDSSTSDSKTGTDTKAASSSESKGSSSSASKTSGSDSAA